VNQDGVADVRAAFEDFEIPETHHPEALAFDERSAPVVIDDGLGMLPAVQFDDQLGVDAAEVGDVAADGILPSPLPAAEPAVAQGLPESGFGAGLAGAEVSCPLGWRIAAHRPPHPTLSPA